MRFLELWAMTLPFGYAVVARVFPERLTWRELSVVAVLVVVWPITALSMLAEDD